MTGKLSVMIGRAPVSKACGVSSQSPRAFFQSPPCLISKPAGFFSEPAAFFCIRHPLCFSLLWENDKGGS